VQGSSYWFTNWKTRFDINSNRANEMQNLNHHYNYFYDVAPIDHTNVSYTRPWVTQYDTRHGARTNYDSRYGYLTDNDIDEIRKGWDFDYSTRFASRTQHDKKIAASYDHEYEQQQQQQNDDYYLTRDGKLMTSSGRLPGSYDPVPGGLKEVSLESGAPGAHELLKDFKNKDDSPRFATDEYDYYIHGFKPMSDRPMQHKRTHIEYGYNKHDPEVGHPTYRRVRSRSLPDLHVSRDGRRLIRTSKRYRMGNDYKITSRRFDFDFGESDDEGEVYQVPRGTRHTRTTPGSRQPAAYVDD
jgi:hypothetical protein